MGLLSGKDGKAKDDKVEMAAGARIIPHVTVQAFCEHSQTAQLIESSKLDRRMGKVALTIHNGGLQGAIEAYRSNPTPNLIIVETSLPPDQIPAALTTLAEVCDAETRVIVLGHVNDVLLYRELIRSGVSEYLVLPADAVTLVNAIAELFVSQDAPPIGRTIGFIPAKGGSGCSTTAHNVAWGAAHALKQEVLIVDLDLPFGTAGLNFNQDPPNGIADAVFAKEKVDATLLERLMYKTANNIHLLAAPGTLDRTYDFAESEFDPIIELSQSSIPLVVLDFPHMWSSWIAHLISTLDQIVVVAEPDLANLRNTKALADTIRQLRPTEENPYLLLNKIGLPKRPEISAAEFASTVDMELIGQVPYDGALFGTAANNGQMIAEVASNNKINDIYRQVGVRVAGRHTQGVEAKASSFDLSGLLSKLKRTG
ncbi:MAG: AAA family ATPase [Hyphomicrobiaceae bacterium]|nr:AAA family ATPase [Hyphomicrobiaceae bacterium]MCC0022695.1 AAA family ATPase [Hyphomicrobiaceae bacterium]